MSVETAPAAHGNEGQSLEGFLAETIALWDKDPTAHPEVTLEEEGDHAA